MRPYLFAALAVCQLAAAADAAAICATPQEMKVLQAAVLQQQLSAAAQSCHYRTDYQAFVNLFANAIVRSDQSLKAFFRRQKGSEGYEAYKSRIAQAVSLHSLHDPHFCASARSVFDVALKRNGIASGVAPVTPTLVETGYEGCRPVVPKPILAAKAPPRATAVAGKAPSKPVAHADKPAALALAKRPVPPIPAPRVIRSAALDLAARSPAPIPTPRMVNLTAQHAVSRRVAAPDTTQSVDLVIDKILATKPAPAPRIAKPISPPPARHAVPKLAEIAKQEAAEPRYASVQRRAVDPANRSRSDEPPSANVPNAYQPGSYWVIDGRLVPNEPPQNRRTDTRWNDDEDWPDD
jgi:hypothetical protein